MCIALCSRLENSIKCTFAWSAALNKCLCVIVSLKLVDFFFQRGKKRKVGLPFKPSLRSSGPTGKARD